MLERNDCVKDGRKESEAKAEAEEETAEVRNEAEEGVALKAVEEEERTTAQ